MNRWMFWLCLVGLAVPAFGSDYAVVVSKSTRADAAWSVQTTLTPTLVLGVGGTAADWRRVHPDLARASMTQVYSIRMRGEAG